MRWLVNVMGPSHVFPDAIDSARNDLILFPIAAGYNHRPEDEIKHRRLGYCDQQRRVGLKKSRDCPANKPHPVRNYGPCVLTRGATPNLDHKLHSVTAARSSRLRLCVGAGRKVPQQRIPRRARHLYWISNDIFPHHLLAASSKLALCPSGACAHTTRDSDVGPAQEQDTRQSSAVGRHQDQRAQCDQRPAT